MRPPLLLVTVLAVLLGIVSVVFPPPPQQRAATDTALETLAPSGNSYSNILPDDYVGPETCGSCHPTQYSQWKEHPHHCMNQLPSTDSVQGDFADACLRLPTGEIHFTTEEDEYWMTVHKQDSVYRRYLVTRTVGSRFMQFYIGKQVSGPEEADHDIYREHMLPFAYWFKIRRWLPRQYFDPEGPDELKNGIPQCEAVDRPPDVRTYGDVCMNCHNTFPYAYRIFRKKLAGFCDATIGTAVAPLSAALASHVHVAPTAEAFRELNDKLDPDKDLVTLGISCESCHFGGREHAKFQTEIRFLPTSEHIRMRAQDPDRPLLNSRDNASTILGICIQCHCGSGPVFPNGAGKANSREGLDMRLGFCSSELSCVGCHEPHTASPQPSGGADNPKHVQVCASCHTKYLDPEAALAHSGHVAAAGVTCLDCHMPRYTQGLDERIRTHRICMPVEPSMVAVSSANACNLCHLDKSMRWTLNELRHGWQRQITPDERWPVYKVLDEPAGEVWLNSKDAHMRLVATQCYAASPLGQDKLPDILRALNDSDGVNRVFAGFAVSRLLGKPFDEPLPVEITAPPVTRARQIDDWLELLELD